MGKPVDVKNYSELDTRLPMLRFVPAASCETVIRTYFYRKA